MTASFPTAASASEGSLPASHVSPAGKHLPVLLALDLGSTTGWALRGSTGAITSGLATFKPSRFEGGGMAFLRFSHWLSELNEQAGPIQTVYFEEVMP